jgi:pimeloyl-ACP methyl ester carboxylesterase
VAGEVLLPPIFADLPPMPFEADIAEDLLPFVLRGAAASDLPGPDELAALAQPALVLAWDGDEGHPLSTAERLAELLPHAELQVATHLRDVLGWPARVAAFLA